MRVLRVYHGGRSRSHRARERELVGAGAQVTLVVPDVWPSADSEDTLSPETFEVVEVPVSRAGDINRHRYPSNNAIRALLDRYSPELLDIHEEPFSSAARQWLSQAPPTLPVTMYTAQNVDKRFPPPFAQHERAAYQRVGGLYPCSRQAAAVARGKGYDGIVRVLPLGFDPALIQPGSQKVTDDPIVLGLFGRLVPEKGVLDAVSILARLLEVRDARLLLVGSGPEAERARRLATRLGVDEHIEVAGWKTGEDLGAIYRATHVALVPSHTTATWVEQFGRVIVESQASGALVAGYSTGSIAEIAGPSAIMTDEGRVDELADRVLATLSDERDFKQRRSASLDRVAAMTWKSVATEQASLYEEALATSSRPKRRWRPGERRIAARVEFGSPASTAGGGRPFALPLLRHGGAAARALATVLDTGAELWFRFGRGRP